MIFIKKNLIDSNSNMFLAVDTWIEINNIITGLNNITLWNVNVKPHGFDEMNTDKDLIALSSNRSIQ